MAVNIDTDDQKTVVGSSKNFWLWDGSGWDLTHPFIPSAPSTQSSLVLPCQVTNVTIDPNKTALLIIDMQNYSMSSELGVGRVPAVFEAQDNLLNFAIPAARKSGIQIIWVNWGLTDDELNELPPSFLRVFGWNAKCSEDELASLCDAPAEERTQCGEFAHPGGLGSDHGQVVLNGGDSIDAGRALMRGTWNAQLHGPLRAAFEEGRQLTHRPDVLLHKNRNSALWDSSTECNRFLAESGIRTLLFAGMNTDQCVLSTIQDAQARGFDAIMLKDVCATGNPDFTRCSAEFNCNAALGFVSTSAALAAATGAFQ